MSQIHDCKILLAYNKALFASETYYVTFLITGDRKW